jgi:subtilase family serine protease
MSKFLLLLFLVLFSGIVFAGDPSITSVELEKVYAGELNTITVHLDSNDLNGNVRFYLGQNLVTQKPFDNNSNSVDFVYNWSNSGVKEISFLLGDFNAVDNNSLNDRVDMNFYVWKGFDAIVQNVTINPTNPKPNTTATIEMSFENIGDENYGSELEVVVMLDGNDVKKFTIPHLIDYYNSSVDINIGQEFFGSKPLRVVINRGADVKEFDYLNNYSSINVSGVQKPDLKINAINVDEDVRKNSLTSIGVAYENTGGVPLKEFIIKVYSNDQEIYSTLVSSIGAESQQTFDFIHSFTSVDEFTIRAVIDSNNNVVEEFEENNEFTTKVSVFDFNLNQVLSENDELVSKNVLNKAEIASLEKTVSDLRSSVSNLERQNSSLTTAKVDCESTLTTKLNTHLVNLDANKDAEFGILTASLSSCETKVIEASGTCDVRIENSNSELEIENKTLFGIIIAISGFLVIHHNKDKLKKKKGSVRF